MIELRDVVKTYTRDDGSAVEVFNGLNLEFAAPNFYTLFGRNGSGKSTLLNLIAGIVKHDSGKVCVRPAEGRRAKIGYVWQDYRSSLLPWLNVLDNISFPLRIQGERSHEARRQARSLLKESKVEIDGERRCFELSGGQQQMVSLLRSLIIKPDVLLMDEPFAALDQIRRWESAAFVEQLWVSQFNRSFPVIFVSHDVDEAVLLADQILVLSDETGRIGKTILNGSERPRSPRMLTSKEHQRCREEVLTAFYGVRRAKAEDERGR